MKSLYGFIFFMWIHLIVGGGILVMVLGPITISGFGDYDMILSSGIKGMAAILLVIVWIVILSKMKKWIFTKMVQD